MPRLLRTVALACGVLGGIVGSQAPEFAQQYRQRLGGAIDELRLVVDRFEADARAAGQSREGAIEQLQGNTDTLVSRQGHAMQAHAARLERLLRQRDVMTAAGPVVRIASMVFEGDRDLMRMTYRDFEPALPMTVEGMLAGLVAFVAVWAATLLAGSAFRSIRKGRSAGAAAS
jgi:Protein of unknown function (DUF2937)